MADHMASTRSGSSSNLSREQVGAQLLSSALMLQDEGSSTVPG
eukprot:CAMPEP_0118983358 /NCGR_PEP_ID=MMETSP1173-20130426/35187_1 /TAXON_ID=1034831 /ORGANISM="Rhizochromulina marina cf, Strain CCMP1243" /LENGTH=42 /DNA_ID= /DNA_START= /DNA_END= /DNA_ORIENTATION=